ncbi:MAG TPA: polysaccharide biosynthesis/export family protein [Pyrinomonadaceae bacterium]|nr:polysaccharide biosynthesis/export family protein [Pyrinomonadaceae bacterium]
MNKTFASLMVIALLLSATVSGFTQTPAVASNAPDTATTKTRQRFAAKPAEDKTAEDKTTEVKTSDPVKSQVKRGSKPDEVKPSTEVVTKPVESLDDVLVADTPPSTADTNKSSLDDVLVSDAPDPSANKSANKSSDIPADTQANRHEQVSEEAAVVPYYNNFFNTYRLGPEDVVSVNVFGQDRYSRSGIIIPPSGRISLALIPGGIFVNGKTVDEVAEAIKKSYDEYIIDPQVSVSLDKASSYRYSVIGDVAQPGIRLMSHRMTVTEALGEAGGVLQTGDRSRVVVLRRQADGNLKPIAVNVNAIYKGKAPDVTYLVPGDQVIVPGNKLKSFQKVMSFFPILSFARIFTGGIFP